MSDLGTRGEQDAYHRALGDVAALQDHLRRWQVLTTVIVLIGLAFTGRWAWNSRDSAVERDLTQEAREAVAAWEQVLERAGRGPLTDADLEAAAVDAGGPEIRLLVDSITEKREYAEGPIEVDYHLESVRVHSHGVVDVTAWIGYQYPITIFDEYPNDHLEGEKGYSSGSESRYLTFVETNDGLRLVRDVSDGKGHGGLTPGIGLSGH